MEKRVVVFFIISFLLITIIPAEGLDIAIEIAIPSEPILLLISPENITYSSNENILLNFTAINADAIWYNLDNTANITITGETLFSTTFASHTLFLFANNSFGTSERNVTFAVVAPPVDDEGNGNGGNGNGGNGGGGGGIGEGGGLCQITWSCTEWTNTEDQCGTRVCDDINTCGTNTNKPQEIITCPDKGIAPQEPYCGDGICNANETIETCVNDCTAIGESTGDKLITGIRIINTLNIIMFLIIITIIIVKLRRSKEQRKIQKIKRTKNKEKLRRLKEQRKIQKNKEK